jgi:hypothetical protein
MSVAAARERIAARLPKPTTAAAPPGPPADVPSPELPRRPPSRRVRLLRVAGLLAIFAGLAAWYGPWRRPDLWKQGPVERIGAWRQTQRCLNYTAPRDHLVCEIGPPNVQNWFTATAGDNTDGRGAWVEGSAAGFLVRSRTPDCLTDLLRPRDSTRRRNGAAGRAALLVHRMKPPGSPPQLVVAFHLPVLNDTAPRGPSGTAEGSDHTTRNAWPVPYRQYFGAMFPWVAPGRVLRLYAAQPDPKDATHFTYAYALDGRAGTVDARLANDDKLHWTVRDGPALDPPEPAEPAGLPPPASLAVVEFRRGTALLNWSPSAGGNAAGYELAFAPTDPDRRAWPGGTSAAADAGEAWVRGLVPDTEYDVRVRAWRGNAYSDWTTIHVTTPPPSAGYRVRVGAGPTTAPAVTRP